MPDVGTSSLMRGFSRRAEACG